MNIVFYFDDSVNEGAKIYEAFLKIFEDNQDLKMGCPPVSWYEVDSGVFTPSETPAKMPDTTVEPFKFLRKIPEYLAIEYCLFLREMLTGFFNPTGDSYYHNEFKEYMETPEGKNFLRILGEMTRVVSEDEYPDLSKFLKGNYFFLLNFFSLKFLFFVCVCAVLPDLFEADELEDDPETDDEIVTGVKFTLTPIKPTYETDPEAYAHIYRAGNQNALVEELYDSDRGLNNVIYDIMKNLVDSDYGVAVIVDEEVLAKVSVQDSFLVLAKHVASYDGRCPPEDEDFPTTFVD